MVKSYPCTHLDWLRSHQEAETHKIFRQSTYEGDKVVSPTHRPPLPPQVRSLVIISFRGWVDPRDIVRPEELNQRKISKAPPGIEPATLRLVATYGVGHKPQYNVAMKRLAEERRQNTRVRTDTKKSAWWSGRLSFGWWRLILVRPQHRISSHPCGACEVARRCLENVCSPALGYSVPGRKIEQETLQNTNRKPALDKLCENAW
jgi:hypothetical protein